MERDYKNKIRKYGKYGVWSIKTKKQVPADS